MAKRKAGSGSSSAMTKRKRGNSTKSAEQQPWQPTGPCHLLNLPVELVEQIVNIVFKSDRAEWISQNERPGHVEPLLALRQTCRVFEAMTATMVSTHFFHIRACILSDRGSLGALRQVTERPKLVRKMARIRFLNGVAAANPSFTSDTRDGRAVRRRAKQSLDEIRKDQSEFQMGEDSQCLQAIFRNLTVYGKTPKIECTGHEIYSPKVAKYLGGVPFGHKRLSEMLATRECLTDGTNVIEQRSYSIIHDAIVDTGFPVTSLSLGELRAGVPLDHYGRQGISAAYQHLRSLKLKIDIEQHYEHPDEVADKADIDRLRNTQGLLEVLRQAQRLTDFGLEISFANKYYHGSHSGIFAAIVAARLKGLIFSKLEWFFLGSQTVPLQVLLDFFSTFHWGKFRDIHLHEIRDREAEYDTKEVSGRIFSAMSAPDPDGSHYDSMTTQDTEGRRFERRTLGPSEMWVFISECYTGGEWMEAERVLRARGELAQGLGPEWPKPWPVVDFEALPTN